jgi:hypothetical protein
MHSSRLGNLHLLLGSRRPVQVEKPGWALSVVVSFGWYHSSDVWFAGFVEAARVAHWN